MTLDPTVTIRRCNHCQRSLPADAFHHANSWCRECRSAYHKAIYNGQKRTCARCGKARHATSYTKSDTMCNRCMYETSDEFRQKWQKTNEALQAMRHDKAAFVKAPKVCPVKPPKPAPAPTTRQCIECGSVKPLDQFSDHSAACRTCAALIHRILQDCKADRIESPRAQCDQCGRQFVSYWGQFDTCARCAETEPA